MLYDHDFLPNLRQGDVLEIDGKRLIFERSLGDGLFQLTTKDTGAPYSVIDPETGTRTLPSTRWLDQIRYEGKVRIIRDRHGPRAARRRPEVVEDLDLIDTGKQSQDRVRRFRWLTALDAGAESIKLSDAWLEGFIAEAKDRSELAECGKAPSPTTLRRWFRSRGAPGDRRLSDMISLQGRAPRKLGFHHLVAAKLERAVAAYWADRSRDIQECYAELSTFVSRLNGRREGWRRLKNGRRVNRAEPSTALPLLKCPSEETFRRAVRARECRDTYAARYGERAAATRFKACGNGLAATRILEIGVLDHTGWDTIAVVDGETLAPLGRPNMVAITDVYSRCVLSAVLSYEPPCHYSATEAVKRANRPKLDWARQFPELPQLKHLHGRFNELVVDNALEVSGGSFRDGLLDAGTSIRFCPVGEPQYKSVGERIFLTVKKLLAHRLPGAVPFSPDKMRELGLDPKTEAILTRAEMEWLIAEALAIYHYEVHRGIGMQPMRRWLESAEKHGIDVIDDEADLDRMLGAVATRKLTRNGIEFENLTYRDPAVVGPLLDELAAAEPVRGRRKGSATAQVKIKYNPANVASIEVYNRKTGRYVTLPCADQRYAEALSLWEHRQIRKFTKAQNEAFQSDEDRFAARLRLRASIEALSPNLKFRHRRAVARLLEPPASRKLDGDLIELARAPARHDGLAPIEVPSAALADVRSDAGEVAPTRRRGGAPSRRQGTARRGREVHPDTGEGEAFARALAPIVDPDAFLNGLGAGWAQN